MDKIRINGSTAAEGYEDYKAGEQVDEEPEYEDDEIGKKPQTWRQFRIVPEPELKDDSGQFRKSGNLGNPEIPDLVSNFLEGD